MVFLPCPALVIPKTIGNGIGMKSPPRIGITQPFQSLKRRQSFRVVQGIPPPFIDIPAIFCFRDNVEITGQQNRALALVKNLGAVLKAFEPIQFIDQFWVHPAIFGNNWVTIGQVKPCHGKITNINLDVAGLFVVHAVFQHRQAAANVIKRHTAGNSNTIIGFLAMGMNVIASIGEQLPREVFIHRFDLLHKQNIRIAGLQPIDHLWATNFDGIDVPTGNF